ncbi:MAG: aldo/keto reductase [Candidatus Taylorbacteria bacterium CG11_big_fil_rev_8_21_14_0_20_46_11]|uniref:Aldo/keto reductase n=1 Tax=Candidatus Taylorbacteria bacterium CG11_big_fil_rev_8_21_14_0_20_46_11 TaxID=1975025 RepID=A0A2H0KDE9_9BACT|nr:MAG: aldo/keto reductase [Candidatus Taylorbacteria bacterium CG11_big_fil_rev_8_21_14_0_20_46_11]
MTIPEKKLKSGFSLPVLGLGTWQMGGRLEADTSNDPKDIEAIRAAIDAGLTHIDTAEMYGQGHTEELVGQAIKGMDRSKLFITSKVAKENHTCDGILESCKKSLARLGVKYLDLYLLHHFSTECPLNEAMKALDGLVEDGLVRAIGVSNFTTAHLKEAQGYTKNKIVCNQVYYNLHAREPETEGLLEYCQKNDVLLVAYRPVEKGALLDDVPDIMDQMCVKHEKKPAQIAINWLISQENVVTLFKTSSELHLKENLGALGWNLSAEDIELLRKEYPNQTSETEMPLG